MLKGFRVTVLFYEGLKEKSHFYRDEKGSVTTNKESLAIREIW